MDKVRWRYEDTNAVVAAVDSATVIEIGDLLWQDVDNAKPASMIAKMFPRLTTEESRMAEFVDHFLGVAMQRSRSGQATPFRVATTGVFEFEVLQGRCWELGDLVGPAKDRIDHVPETLVLRNQAIEKVDNSKYAIGRIAQRESVPAPSVLVAIRSTVMTGGILVR